MRHIEGTFEGVDGVQLYYQNWHPQGSVRAVLALVHGLGSHSNSFANVVHHLIPRGYTVYGFDLRGHGRSPGQRGYINAWSEFRQDLRSFLNLIDRKERGAPRFLWGHSLGSAIALDYVLRFPSDIQGVMASALPIGKIGVSPLRLAAGKLLSCIWPRFSLNTGMDLAAGSRDQAVVTAHAQDPLRHTKGTARLVTEFLTTRTWLQTHAAELKVPLLMLHGGSDRTSSPDDSRAFFQQITFPEKQHKEYVGGYHDLHEDLNFRQMLSDVENWLERYLDVKVKATLIE